MIYDIRSERAYLDTQKQYILSTLAIRVSPTSYQLILRLLGKIKLFIAVYVDKSF